MGSYCPAGSSSPALCDPGTYLPSTGSNQVGDCISCTAGQYCPGTGNSNPAGDCDVGYYCPGGQASSNPTTTICPVGHYCPAGSLAEIRCLFGSYQDEVGKGSCKSCPSGYFCDNTLAPVVLYNSSICPAGFYCPENTTRSNEFPCPVGTFISLTTQGDVSDCQPCTGGDYCDSIGLAAPTGRCSAGYFCVTGATGAAPTQGLDADICPKGFYCPEGTLTPQPCPPGTFNPITGLQRVDQCTDCIGGTYCPTANMVLTGPACEQSESHF